MKRIYNGMPASQLGSAGWHRPWNMTDARRCVEALKLADGRVALRRSDDPDGPALIYAPHEIEAFISGAKNGEADFLVA
jgi:hypothetical protein